MNTRTLATDFSTWERGHAPQANEMLALYESDFIVEFAVDGMTEDATDKWLKDFEEPNPENPIAPKIVQAMKWAELFGDTLFVPQDPIPDTITDPKELEKAKLDTSSLAKDREGVSAGCDVFHPLADGDGYDDPTPAELDNLGNPTVFHVHFKGKEKAVDIKASRCIIFKGRSTRRSWRGLFIAIASIDDIIDYRKWRAAYGVRAGDVAEPAYHVNKEDAMGAWSPAEKTSIDNAFGVNKVALTTGKVTVNPITMPLTVGELDSTSTGLLNAIAKDLGISLNDLFDHMGNAEKVAPDSNQTSYMIAIISRQKRHTDAVTKALKAFGIEFTGWNSPWEEPMATKITNISSLATTYNSSMDPEIRAVTKALLMSTYGEETEYEQYIADETANAEREEQRLDEFARGGAEGASGKPGAGKKPGSSFGGAGARAKAKGDRKAGKPKAKPKF
jgi:hypothetical protein